MTCFFSPPVANALICFSGGETGECGAQENSELSQGEECTPKM